MNTLPSELEHIVYKYLDNLKKNDLLKELKNSFYVCDCCEIEYSSCINPIYLHCLECKKTICSNCPICPEEYKNDYCHDCILKNDFFYTIEKKLNRQIDENEKQRFLFLQNISEYNLENNIDMYFIDDVEIFTDSFKNIISIIEKFEDKKYTAQELYDLIYHKLNH